jgi:asparagine synthase (glutamine-hydrolysing)
MPGITGIIGFSRQDERTEALRLMVNAMMHDRWYRDGKYAKNQLGLWLGWVCIQGSFADCLPVWNERKDIGLVFAGEEFSEETEGPRGGRHQYKPGTAGYLVGFYEEYGTRFLKKLNGWFSGVLMDLREGTIHIFNDRYGLSRIYYYENEDGLYFSSEAKSLLCVLPHLRQFDFRSLAETFSCGCALQNRTLFSGVSLLPGGSVWSYKAGEGLTKAFYFKKEEWESQPPLPAYEYHERLKASFAKALPKYLAGNSRVAMSLTGGLDGRMIMAWGADRPGKLPCYTFGGTYRDSADVAIARKVAAVCQQPHTVITVGAEFLREFPDLAEKSVYISDGALDATGSLELYVNRIAREIAPVRLTGNYGSEILRGNVAFKPDAFDKCLFEPEFARLLQEAATTYAKEACGRLLSFIVFKQVPWHHYSRLSVEQSQLTLRSPYLDNDLVALAYQAPLGPFTGEGASLRLVADANRLLSRIPTDRGLIHPPPPFFTKANRLLQGFTFRAEYAYGEGMPQWFAPIDRLFSPLRLERLFLGRHRFHNFRVWYRDILSTYLKEVLLDSRTLGRSYLNKTFLRKMVIDHVQGKRNHTNEIHRVLAAELTHRKLIEMA